MALADVYDALISKRVYKAAMPHAEAMSIIREGSGAHFDHELVNAFIRREKEMRDIGRSYRDDE